MNRELVSSPARALLLPPDLHVATARRHDHVQDEQDDRIYRIYRMNTADRLSR